MDETGDVILEVRSLNKIYGEDVGQEVIDLLNQGVSKEEIRERTGAVVGVRDVSFQVHRGEFFVIMGLSGSGKSTLARCLIRLVEPTTGEILIEGEDVASADERELREIRRTKLAMVFQHYGLLPHKTVLENVEYGLKTRGIDGKEREQAARAAIERVGLTDWEDSRPSALSGGMQQRVGLARAFAHNPHILLMDEPFSGLDPLIRRDMQDEFATLRAEEEITTIFVTHDLDEALKLGDRIAIMRAGEIIQIATPADLVTNPVDDYVERFVEGASPARFMTAEQVMEEDVAVIPCGASISEAISFFDARNVTSTFVVDEHDKLSGVLSWFAVARKPDGPIEKYIQPATTARRSARLENIVSMAVEVDHPIAVVNRDNRLLGSIRRLDLLQTLALDLEEEMLADTSANGSSGAAERGEPDDLAEEMTSIKRQAIGD